MAFSYSENFEQWTFRQQSFDDDSSWMSSIHETETLTKALQQSFSGGGGGGEYSSEETPLAGVHQQQFLKPDQSTTTPTVSGSDPETTTTTTTSSITLKQQRRNNHHHQILKGKISKRKSRATNRSPITFITADPMNFRQMVQQVTGIRMIGGGANGGGGGNLQMPVMKPEAKRPGDLMLINGGYNLPTLDTSAFLLEQQQRQQQQLIGSNTSSTVTSPTHVNSSYHHGPVVVVASSQVNNTSFDFDTLQSFPTLESWGVI